MTAKNYKIKGMTCMHCVMAVKKELSKVGLESFEVEIGSAKVKYDESKVDSKMVDSAIIEAGYQIEEVNDEKL
ncbi:MAG: cation transporter [Bacteroidota bacterium]